MLNRRADKLELLRIAEAVALEKSIDKELIINSMERGIAKAAKSKFGPENEIHVQKQDKYGKVISDLNVPLAYGPRGKFLARLEQLQELNKPTAISLPRMSFEMTDLSYDATRKTSVTKTYKALDNNDKVKKVYLPVPYNIGFELNIMCKLNDDALQIVEQILPFFQPAFNITVDLVSSIGEKRDIPVVLENISFTDEYEGDFTTRRVLMYTMTFSAKTYLFGPIAESTDGIIRKVQVDYYTNTDKQNAKREMRYTATPDPVDAEPDDDFGFSEESTMFFDSKQYSPTRREDV